RKKSFEKFLALRATALLVQENRFERGKRHVGNDEKKGVGSRAGSVEYDDNETECAVAQQLQDHGQQVILYELLSRRHLVEVAVQYEGRKRYEHENLKEVRGEFSQPAQVPGTEYAPGKQEREEEKGGKKADHYFSCLTAL